MKEFDEYIESELFWALVEKKREKFCTDNGIVQPTSTCEKMFPFLSFFSFDSWIWLLSIPDGIAAFYQPPRTEARFGGSFRG